MARSCCCRQPWQLRIKKSRQPLFFFDFVYKRALETLVFSFFSIETASAALVRAFWQPSSSLTLWAGPRIFNKQRLSLSVTQNSQDHRASFRLVQGRPGCGCCVATERATPAITISAKVVLKMQLKCSPERECNYTNRLTLPEMPHRAADIHTFALYKPL